MSRYRDVVPTEGAPDAVLWARVSQGDEAAFEDLYRAHVSVVSRYLARRVPLPDVDDVVASVFLEAWRQRERVRLDVSRGMDPWLLGVARNLARAHYRQASTRALPSEVVADESARPVHEVGAEFGDAAVLFEQRLEHDRQVACARAALASLSDDDQLILDLVVVEGRSPSEAARLLGITAVAARSRLHRGRSRLATAFDALMADDSWVVTMSAGKAETDAVS